MDIFSRNMLMPTSYGSLMPTPPLSPNMMMGMLLMQGISNVMLRDFLNRTIPEVRPARLRMSLNSNRPRGLSLSVSANADGDESEGRRQNGSDDERRGPGSARDSDAVSNNAPPPPLPMYDSYRAGPPMNSLNGPTYPQQQSYANFPSAPSYGQGPSSHQMANLMSGQAGNAGGPVAGNVHIIPISVIPLPFPLPQQQSASLVNSPANSNNLVGQSEQQQMASQLLFGNRNSNINSLLSQLQSQQQQQQPMIITIPLASLTGGGKQPIPMVQNNWTSPSAAHLMASLQVPASSPLHVSLGESATGATSDQVAAERTGGESDTVKVQIEASRSPATGAKEKRKSKKGQREASSPPSPAPLSIMVKSGLIDPR